MLSFKKNVHSNVCLGFFGTDTILAHAKAWDLVCKNVPDVQRPFDLLQLLYFHRRVNTFKTPEMCLYLDSDVWAKCFTIIFGGSFHYFQGCCLTGGRAPGAPKLRVQATKVFFKEPEWVPNTAKTWSFHSHPICPVTSIFSRNQPKTHSQ